MSRGNDATDYIWRLEQLVDSQLQALEKQAREGELNPAALTQSKGLTDMVIKLQNAYRSAKAEGILSRAGNEEMLAMVLEALRSLGYNVKVSGGVWNEKVSNRKGSLARTAAKRKRNVT